MSLIGREIVQVRSWEDGMKQPPTANYKYQYPITVLKAIKRNVEEADDPDAENLDDIITDIYAQLRAKQPIFPSFSANNLMTFAGDAGAVGAIPITREIPWDPNKQSHERIPTEKAVGDLMFKLGLLDENGDPIDSEQKIRWSDIIGRPMLFDGLGNSEEGFITQKGTTQAINSLKTQLLDSTDELTNRVNSGLESISKHLANKDNPHAVTYSQIGAASATAFNDHISAINPHNIMPVTIGLGNVDNTSDMDKPISTKAQEALNVLRELIDDLAASTDALDYLSNGTYDIHSGKLILTFRHGHQIVIDIPIDDLVDEITYDQETKELVITELNGEVNRIDVSDLFIRYIGSVSDSITVEIIGTNETGEQIIKATLNDGGITSDALGDGSIITRVLADKSVTGEKIADNTILTVNYKDESVTTEKIAKLAVTTTRLDDRAVTGQKLFSSPVDNRVLAVLAANSNPVWMRIIREMIDDNAVETRHLSDNSVITTKLVDRSVVEEKLDDSAVTTDKIHDKAVTHDKMAEQSVGTENLLADLELFGVPKLKVDPLAEVKDKELVDAHWVLNKIDSHVNENKNYGDRSVDGRVLFSSPDRHRVLAVLRANSDPVWSLIDNDMMAVDSVGNKNIINDSITGNKIKDGSVDTRHIADYSVTEPKIGTSAVTPEKIFTSHTKNMVLAALTDDGHPQYVKILQDMIEHNAIGTEQIQDGSVTPDKVQTSEDPYMILGVMLAHSNPVWTKVSTNMIADRAVAGKQLFSSPDNDMILGVTTKDTDPAWMKINSAMIMENAIKREHIEDGAIWEEHLQENIIGAKHIQDRCIDTHHIKSQAITGNELFRSPYNWRVLATVGGPYAIPEWAELDGRMLKDESIVKEKLFRSENPYRVLATTQAGTAPEYIKINSNFIVDDSILPQKLVRNFILFGTPEITVDPDKDADNYQVPSTHWVRNTISDIMNDFHPDILFNTIYTEMLTDKAVTGDKLFRSRYDGPRVIGVTDKDEVPEYMLVENGMIADGAVTEEKLERDIHLLGTPTIDVRPSPIANDANGTGSQVPDCQWVLDRIKDAGLNGGPGTSIGGGGSTTITIPTGSVETKHIQDRAVTGRKLFTSVVPDRVLAVIKENSDPVYTQVTNAMIGDREIDMRTLISSSVSNRLLGVHKAGDNPEWLKINHNMLEENIIDTDQLMRFCVTTEKLANASVTREKLPDYALIDQILMCDNSVTTRNIVNASVTTEKVADKSITSEKLADDLSLRGTTTVESGTDYIERRVRNTIISTHAPENMECGDIWFKYE